MQKFRLKCDRKTRLKNLKKGEKQTRPKSRHFNKQNILINKKLFEMIAKYMNSYLKQARIKNVEKIKVNRYKLLLNFNDPTWNINKYSKHCAYI